MKVIAVTSCATGIAHTYMAAEAIKKVCKKKGYECKVETQGALGHRKSAESQRNRAADLIVFANDVGVSKAERFDACKDKIKKFSPHDVIKNPDIIFE